MDVSNTTDPSDDSQGQAGGDSRDVGEREVAPGTCLNQPAPRLAMHCLPRASLGWLVLVQPPGTGGHRGRSLVVGGRGWEDSVAGKVGR